METDVTSCRIDRARVRDGLNICTKIPKSAEVNFTLKREIYPSSRSRNIYSYIKESPYFNET